MQLGIKRFIDNCAAEKIFDGVHKVLIAVSGGADSLALAELMINSRQRFSLELVIAHFEHGLRGQESIDDAAFVKNFAEERGIKFIGGHGNVKKFAATNKISVETAARTLRYEFLSNIRRDLNFDAIALAHHADDQAETILMRLLRGATSAGLSAMKFRTLSKDYGLLIRPLLRFRKVELENFCRMKNLLPRLDATNLELDATRNKIRLELIPTLERFNPALVETLCRLAEVTAEETDFIDTQAEKIFPAVVKNNSIVRADFLKLPPALQRVVIKKFLAQVTGSAKDFGFVHFEGVRKVLIHGLAGVELPKNLRADLRKGKLIITKKKGLIALKSKEDYIERVLYTEEEIAARAKELSAQISEDYKDIAKPLLTVGILNGAVMFYTDVVRRLTIPVQFDFLIASSYDANSHTTGKVNILKNLDNDPKGRDILLVEDIIDSGTTMNFLIDYFMDKKANSVKICTLLNKPSRRKVDVKIDYCGFDVPDEFIVGYGLDFAQHYRNLPYLGILNRSVYGGK